MLVRGERSAAMTDLSPALERFEVTIVCAQAEQASTQYESDRPSVERTGRRRWISARGKAASGHACPIRIGITTLCEFEDRLPRRAVGSSETDQGRMIECRAAAGTVGGECAVELHRRSRAAPVSTAGVPHLSARDGRIASNTPMHGRNLADVIEPT